SPGPDDSNGDHGIQPAAKACKNNDPQGDAPCPSSPDAPPASSPGSGGSSAGSQPPSPGSGGSSAGSQPPSSGLEVWLAPGMATSDFRALFSDPPRWENIRKEVNVIKFYEQVLSIDGDPSLNGNGITDFATAHAFSLMKTWNIKVALEAGA